MADERRTGEDGLDRRIADFKTQHPGTHGLTNAQARAEGRGWAVGVEFIGTVLVCGLIGWLLDHYVFHSTPWAMIVLLVLGFAAGTRRAMATSRQFDDSPANDPR